MEIVIGLLSGIMASMGLGGGFVLLLYLTAAINMNQVQAQGINLVFFLPIAVISIIIHQKNGYLEKSPLLPAISFGIIGVFAGSYIAFQIPVEWLSKAFGIFILVFGIRELFFPKKETPEDSEKTSREP